MLRTTKVDLLFTDMVMPGELNGSALARRVAGIVPGINVLFTSGFPEARTDVGGWLDANIKLLSKPYRKDELARTLRQALDAPSAAEQKPIAAAS